MRQAAAILTFAGFFLWIQPLGAFIKPSAEDTACGGNRAFHMCSTQFTQMLESAPVEPSVQKTHLTASSSVGAEKTNPSSSGAQMTANLSASPEPQPAIRFIQLHTILPRQAFFSPATPVPKR